MLLKAILYFFLFYLRIHNVFAKTMTPEPEEYWPHVESPDELEEKLRAFRLQFDDFLGLKYGDPCGTEGNLTELYMNMNKALQINYETEDDKYNMFDPTHSSYADRNGLEKVLSIAKTDANKVRRVCPITKGMICGSTTLKCECNQGDVLKFIPESRVNELQTTKTGKVTIKAEYDVNSGACYLEPGSYCSEDWETKCASPYACFVEKDENQPEDDLLCTTLNLEKYNLIRDQDDPKGDRSVDSGNWKCFCGPSKENRADAMQKLMTSIQKMSRPFGNAIAYDGDCEAHFEYEQHYQKLEKVLETSSDSDDFFQNHYRPLQTKLVEGTKFLCRKTRNAVQVCNGKKCACKYDGVHDDSTCSLQTGSECDSEGHPYPCPKGEKCLIESKTLSQAVLCSPDTLKVFSGFDGIPKKCKCSSSSNSPKTEFSSQDLQGLANESVWGVAKYVREEYENWTKTFLEKDEPCKWDKDRDFFQMDDYIRAGLQHVFFKTRFYTNIANMDNAEKKVCNITKSLRCDFLTEKCDCPTDGYLLEDIPSEWDPVKERCVLKSGSTCHPTLTEWIHCPDKEQCLYTSDGVNILCNRANQREIVTNKLRLSSAKCQCSNKKPRQIDDALKKRLGHKERIEF